MGGSISKKESEPDRLGRKLDAVSPVPQQYPGPLRPPEFAVSSPGGDPNAISLSTQAGFVGPPGGAGVASSVAGLDVAQAATAGQAQQSVVPTVFRWEHGGNQVYITGTFNGWSRKVPMHRSGNDFLFIQSLPKGRHAYKFVVDDEWRFAPDQPTVADTAGNINNYIDLTTFKPDEDEPISILRRDSLPDVAWGRTLPDEDEYSKEPPLLPPHLRTIILNSASPDAADPLALPAPAHVCLNHLYCTAIKDGLMVQATSHRYRRKAVTTVFYSATPPSSQSPGGGLMPLPGLMAQQPSIGGQTPRMPGGRGGYGTVIPSGLQTVMQGAQGRAQLQQQATAMGGNHMAADMTRPPAHPVAPPPLPMPVATGNGYAQSPHAYVTHSQPSPVSGMGQVGQGTVGHPPRSGSSSSSSGVGPVLPGGGGRRASINSGDYASKVAAAYSSAAHAASGSGHGQAGGAQGAGGNYAGY